MIGLESHIGVRKQRRAEGLTHQRALQVIERDARLLPQIQALCAEFPLCGYWKLWIYLRFVGRLPVDKRRVLQMMRKHRPLITPNLRLPAKRMPTRSTPRPSQPRSWWGIDMPKALVQNLG
jgi:hypothetical protein